MNSLDEFGDLAEEFGFEPKKPPLVIVAPFSGVGVGVASVVEPRERCLCALAALDALDAERARLRDAAQREYERDLEALWRQVKRRGKKAFSRHHAEQELGKPAHDLAARHVAAHKAATVVAYDVKRKELEKIADEAAAVTVIGTRPGAEWYYSDHYATAYQSTGSGEKYARAMAEITAESIRAVGVGADVRQHEASTKFAFFAVMAHCIEADLPILRRKAALPLVEMVRLAWKLGVNPRVYWPSLPHGFEEANGLDFFGNIRAPAQKSESRPAPEPEPI